MRTSFLWLVSVVLAVLVSLLGRVILRRPGGEARREAMLTTLPILLGGLLGIAATGPLQGQAVSILVAGAILGLPWIWEGRRRFPLKPIAALVVAIAIVLQAGLRISSFKHPVLQLPVDTGPFAIPLTAAWLVAMTLAFYSTRRLEGMALPVVSVASAAFVLIMLIQRQHLTVARGLGMGISGASAGLVLLAPLGIRPPARDGTAAAGGFLLASAAVAGMSKTSAVLSLVVPLLILAIPALSMTTLVLDRVRRRVVVTEVRQDFYGLLLNRGLPRHKVIIFVTALEAYLAAVTVFLAVLRPLTPLMKAGIFVLAAVAAAPIFSRFLRLLLSSPSRPRPAGEPSHLLEMKVDAIGMREAVGRIEQFIASREPHHVVTGDTMALERTLADQEFRDVVNAAHMVTADGIGVVWAARLFGVPINERVSGIDLMQALFARSAEQGYRLYFLGGKPGIAEEAAQKVSAAHPGIRIVGTHHGYFAPDEEPAVIRTIRETRPDVLFVALGSPRQDHWIRRHIGVLGVPVCIGVGGSLDVLAGHLHRAPRWMQTMGLEWVYRGIQEPWRLQRWLRFPRVISESLKRKILSYWS